MTDNKIIPTSEDQTQPHDATMEEIALEENEMHPVAVSYDELQDSETAEAVEAEEDSEITPDMIANESILVGISQEQFNQLTSKNKQFMISVDKQLHSQLRDTDLARVNQELVETLAEGQMSNQTARQIYGTPSETVDVILQQEFASEETDVERSPDWQIALDGGLMLGSIFTFITGFSLMNANEGAVTTYMGIITLIVNYVAAGFAMLASSKVMPDLDAPKGEKGIVKYILVSTGAMALWFFLVTLSATFISPAFNPGFEPWVYLVIGAATFALRMYFNRKYKIKGGIF